jgi:hypothetical protein
MLARGCCKENGASRLLIGYYHSSHLAYGFQQVSGSLFDGRSSRGRNR